jgi:sigma-54 dependent transcriptional regulator, acetoin dehydrogenase operon transcriptional activator AcoR
VLAPGAGAELRAAPAAVGPKLPLKDLETELIRQAVRDAKGNVAKAAQQLGISRATVYRKLGQRSVR